MTSRIVDQQTSRRQKHHGHGFCALQVSRVTIEEAQISCQELRNENFLNWLLIRKIRKIFSGEIMCLSLFHELWCKLIFSCWYFVEEDKILSFPSESERCRQNIPPWRCWLQSSSYILSVPTLKCPMWVCDCGGSSLGCSRFCRTRSPSRISIYKIIEQV